MNTKEKITVIDESHDYSLLLRFHAYMNSRGEVKFFWFDIVDNTELNF